MSTSRRSISPPPTLVLSAVDLQRLLAPADYVAAVAAGVVALARGELTVAPVGHLGLADGVLHVKMAAGGGRAAVKLNANLPRNPQQGRPTVQGVIVLFDTVLGSPLAVLDSAEITAWRTAATTAVAVRHLAPPRTRRLAVIGCGVQGRCHVEILAADGRFAEVVLHDLDTERAERLAAGARDWPWRVETAASPRLAAIGADVVICCTTATQPVLSAGDVAPGALVAAVGADNPNKRELAGDLVRGARLIPDLYALAVEHGELRHALAEGSLRPDQIGPELPAIVAGAAAARRRAEETVIFDSTGLAIADLAAASLAYDRAREADWVVRIPLAAPFASVRPSEGGVP